MRVPGLSSLIAAFGPAAGTEAYRLLKGQTDPRTDPAVVAWAAQCYHDPRENTNAYGECLMLALNRVLSGCGVETIRGRHVDRRYHGDIQAAYVNFGDTYDLTLLLDHETGNISLISWGDWVERHERRRQIA